MAVTAIQDSPSAPSWFTPRRLLVILCVINMLNYVDRGAIASNGVNGSIKTCDDKGICTSGSGIQGDFNLNNFQDGVLSSAFMVGLLVASPIFASLAKSHNPFRLIGFGLSVWTFATAGCGCSIDFWSITICRMLVGVGEASFISLAAPFIDDNAPAAQKTSWLATFYMCIPTGVALGYVYGGFVGNHTNWRYAFWGESLLMLPFAVLGFVMKPLQMRGFSHAPSNKALTSIESVASVTEGYASYTFVLGAYSYWGPKAGYSIYHMSNADLMFGGVTIVCGIFGTLGGGLVLDRMNATISNAFKLLSGAAFLGAIFCFSAFCLSNLYGFLFLFAVGELFVFAAQAPVNYVSLHCVKPGMRPLSMAISTVSIHILGDVPSSPLVGILEDHINNWRVTSLILTSVLLLAAGIWFIGIFVKSVDMFNEDETSSSAKDSMAPLLEENKVENEIADNNA
ncbi:probable sphingolipid transporter spinster homolog 2 isoform X2 [Euphorbia lathyris]|uniref:probable sphingolipid transporter spinster homolog 2 isoform X2 n=1 Tax=Euphorbia lathyris TaxID=212925 RepID=UPI003313770E